MHSFKMGLLSVLLAGGFASAGWGGDCSKISVAGSATKELKPDVAYITVYVNGDGILMSDAAKKADENVETMIKAIREGRSNIVDVTISTIDVGEKSSRIWNSDQQNAAPRPQVSKQVRIAIPPDPTLAYNIIDSAIRAGAILTRETITHYSGEVRGTVVYGVKDGEMIEDELKKSALDDARKQAEKTALWAGKTVGPLCSIGCQSLTTTDWPQSINFGGNKSDYPTRYLGTDPDKIEIKATVSASFDLQEPPQGK